MHLKTYFFFKCHKKQIKPKKLKNWLNNVGENNSIINTHGLQNSTFLEKVQIR